MPSWMGPVVFPIRPRSSHLCAWPARMCAARIETPMTLSTVVIGGGPAGLAVGATLRRQQLPVVILERAPDVGSSWRRHYDRLHLHTPKSHSALPFVPYPKSYPRYPSRALFVEYLENYARTFELDPQYGQNVVRCTRDGDELWLVETESAEWRCRNLVVATGFNRIPKVPSWPGEESFPGPRIHSYDYRNGEPFRGKKVLVVGFGNSGAEIATDLVEHGAECNIVVRSAVNIVPRDIAGIPATLFAIASQSLPPRVADAVNALTIRLCVGNLAKWGIPKRNEGPFVEIVEHQHVPIVDVGALPLIRQGRIALRPAIERFDGEDVCFADGRRERYDAVVLATGFDVGLRGLFPQHPELFNASGLPRAFGCETAPGLYFCGFRLTPTGFLRQISQEALRIGESIGGPQTRTRNATATRPVPGNGRPS
jgi:indole-3-pyruvate monooxygenase